MLFIDLTQKRFGRLLVVKNTGTVKHGAHYWLCRCDCGTEKEISGRLLRKGETTSCGCKARELSSRRRLRHGMSETRKYSCWLAMKRRCTNEGGDHWYLYGGRGITVCDRWMNSFEAFYADMGPCPPGCTIERKNVNGHYEPSNCCWLPADKQSANRRPASEWSRRSPALD
jgi:hypothetical protein